MVAPNKFESQNEKFFANFFFSIKNAIFPYKFSCNHYFLELKVIFMQGWTFYVLTPIQISTAQKNVQVTNKGARYRWRDMKLGKHS